MSATAFFTVLQRWKRLIYCLSVILTGDRLHARYTKPESTSSHFPLLVSVRLFILLNTNLIFWSIRLFQIVMMIDVEVYVGTCEYYIQ